MDRLSVVPAVQPSDDLVRVAGDDDITGHVFDDDRVYADGHVVADGYVADDFRTGRDKDVVADRGAFAFLRRLVADEHSRIERAVIADMRFRVNDNGSPVPYRQTLATGVRGDLKAGFVAQPAQSPGPIDMADEIPAFLWRILVVFQMTKCHDILPDAVLVGHGVGGDALFPSTEQMELLLIVF